MANTKFTNCPFYFTSLYPPPLLVPFLSHINKFISFIFIFKIQGNLERQWPFISTNFRLKLIIALWEEKSLNTPRKDFQWQNGHNSPIRINHENLIQWTCSYHVERKVRGKWYTCNYVTWFVCDLLQMNILRPIKGKNVQIVYFKLKLDYNKTRMVPRINLIYFSYSHKDSLSIT